MKCRKCNTKMAKGITKCHNCGEMPPMYTYDEVQDMLKSVEKRLESILLQIIPTKPEPIGHTLFEHTAHDIIRQMEVDLSKKSLGNYDHTTLVILESPYAGDVEFNLNYARKCLSDSLARGESPIASHLLYPQVLNDCEPNERKQGIEAGLDWLKVAKKQVFYVDLGWSEGMRQARIEGERLGIENEERKIFK